MSECAHNLSVDNTQPAKYRSEVRRGAAKYTTDSMQDLIVPKEPTDLLAARRRYKPRTPLQWLLGLPGRLGDRVSRQVQLDSSTTDMAGILEMASAAKRSNGYLALEPDLRYFRVHGCAFAYRLAGRTAFAVGGILGDEGAFEDALIAFRSTARASGIRRVLLFPVSQSELGQVRRSGFGTVQVGSEALLNPQQFHMDGGQSADLRQMCNRARKRFNLVVKELDPRQDGEALENFFSEWRGCLARPPLHLVLGSPCIDRPCGRRYMAALDETSTPVAVVTLTPSFGGTSWGVDVMSRLRTAPAGSMDLLLAEICLTLRAEGVEHFSLGSCPMSEHAPVARDDHRLLRVAFRSLYSTETGNRLFRFRGLAHFKAKFDPVWEPVFIAGWPNIGLRTLYAGCRMWGVFGDGTEVFSHPADS